MIRTTYNKESKLWAGDDFTPFFNPKISLGEIVLRSLFNNASKIAQISDDCNVQMTFDEIRIKSIRAARNLQQLGYHSNDIFGFVARNSKNVAPILFASLFNGCPLHCLDPNLSEVELIHMFKMTKPRLIFCDVQNYDLVAKCMNDLGMNSEIFTFCGQQGESKNVESLFVENGHEDQFVPVKVDGENHIAIIISSSGTTGLPKGVCLSHAACAFYLEGWNMMNGDDVILCFSPLFWLSGILTILIGTLKGSTRIITTENFTAELQIRMIEKYKVTYIISPIHHVALTLKCDQLKTANLSSLKCYFSGGNKVPSYIPKEYSKYFKSPLSITYGMSEIGIVTIDYPFNGQMNAVGQITVGFVVKIINKNGERCGPNVDGEICVKSPVKFFGYFGNEKATRDVFDSEGFLMTGDIGHFDDNGYLYFFNRKKDMLKYQSHHLTPYEIEDYLIQRPDIDSVCVVGIPDGMGSDLPAAVVIRNTDKDITDEILNSIADHFSDHYKLRGGVYFVDSFPFSSNGKLLRRKVMELAIELFGQKPNIK